MGWLDLDSSASERVATLLRSLDEPGTIDALGLGSIRDAFSDMLTPGTSTVQTRLRYFMFVPWIFQRLEAEAVTPASFARKLRYYEVGLISCLRRLDQNEGVIGRIARSNLRRMPSDIYWGSMTAWGIRRFSLSIAEYGQQVAAQARRRIERDEDGNAIKPSAPMWAAIPPEPPRFLDHDLSFELEPAEAQVLAEGIRRCHPDTLIAVLSAEPGLPLDGIDYPWLVPSPRLPDCLAELLRHGRCFSELTHGPRLVYNLLVARKAHIELGWSTEELIDAHVEQLKDWASLIESRHEDLRAWAHEPEEFRQLLASYNITNRTLHFWNDLARRAVNDPSGFAENQEVHRLVHDRERRLKTGRARLTHRAALESGGQPASVDRLDYRWSITKRYLKDLEAAGIPS
jgi:hypothetical protein